MLPLVDTSLVPVPIRPVTDAEVVVEIDRDPAALLTGWFAEVATGEDLHPRLLRLADGRLLPLPVARWAGPVDVADESLLVRALGPVLDVGCGPGRLTAALHRRGVEVLGLELVDEIPVLAREAGAPLHLGDIYGPVPHPRTWQTILLADGNIGIGGDVTRMLARCSELIADAGEIVVEIHPDAEHDRTFTGRLVDTQGHESEEFPWAEIGLAAILRRASALHLDLRQAWRLDDRNFCRLAKR